MRQVHRFVAAALRLRLQVTRQQVRPVRLEQQPLGRNRAHDFAQVHSATLVRNPAGDADVQAEIEVLAGLGNPGGEAMRDAADQLRAVFAQDSQEVVMGVALMQEYRLAQLNRKVELASEGDELRGAW